MTQKNKKQTQKKNNKLWEAIKTHIYSLNNSKFFAGIIMLIMNIGSKYITVELSKTQESYIKYTLGRQLLIFAIIWMGTKDIFISLILTIMFIISADYLFNENSKFCIIPKSHRDKVVKAMDTNGDGVISEEEVDQAINILNKAYNKKQMDNGLKDQKQDVLNKEHFI